MKAAVMHGPALDTRLRRIRRPGGGRGPRARRPGRRGHPPGGALDSRGPPLRQQRPLAAHPRRGRRGQDRGRRARLHRLHRGALRHPGRAHGRPVRTAAHPARTAPTRCRSPAASTRDSPRGCRCGPGWPRSTRSAPSWCSARPAWPGSSRCRTPTARRGAGHRRGPQPGRPWTAPRRPARPRSSLTGDREADAAALAGALGDSAPSIVVDLRVGAARGGAFRALGRRGLNEDSSDIAYVQIGAVAGPEASVPSSLLRSRGSGSPAAEPDRPRWPDHDADPGLHAADRRRPRRRPDPAVPVVAGDRRLDRRPRRRAARGGHSGLAGCSRPAR